MEKLRDMEALVCGAGAASTPLQQATAMSASAKTFSATRNAKLRDMDCSLVSLREQFSST
jgi:hypothetical protein